MKHWYKVVVKTFETAEDDRVKQISREYLFEAISYADAEHRAIEHFLSYQNVQGEISKVTKTSIVEIIDNESFDVYFDAKVQYIIFDEKSKSEKRTTVKLLVASNNIDQAFNTISETLGKTNDYEIINIGKTKILEVFDLADNANVD